VDITEFIYTIDQGIDGQ